MANENNAEKSRNAEKPKKRNRIKETFSELKKVTWPTFGKVVKQTGTVIVVTLFFMLILMLMDWLLGLGHAQLIKGLQTTDALTTAVTGIGRTVTAFFAPAVGLPIQL